MPRCLDCQSKFDIHDFVERVHSDPAFANELNEVMASGVSRRVGEFLCHNSYSATVPDFVNAMLSEVDNPKLSNLAGILAVWGVTPVRSDAAQEVVAGTE